MKPARANRPFGIGELPSEAPAEPSSEFSEESESPVAELEAQIAKRRAQRAAEAAAASSKKGAAAASDAAAGTAVAFPAAVVMKMLVFLALTGLIGYGAMSMRGPEEEDPHFLQAKRILRGYELGREPASLNYDDPVYPQALSELGLVDPDSISGRPASELANDINARILKFRQRVSADKVRAEQDASAEAARNAEILRNQIMTTGIDSGAAERTTARSKTECLEEENAAPHKH